MRKIPNKKLEKKEYKKNKNKNKNKNKTKQNKKKPKQNQTKPKNFYPAKETVNQWKRQPTEGVRFSSHASVEGLISRIFRGL